MANELVGYLVDEAKKQGLKEVYCLPFEELKHFYEKFGFKTFETESTPTNEKV